MRRFLPTLAIAAMVMIAGASADAQTRVHTEMVRPGPLPPANAGPRPEVVVTGNIPPPPEVVTDVTRLPPAVARMRERILAAARTGELEAVVAVMRSNGNMPIFSLNAERDPLTYWRRDYPESGGVEILAILADILETGFVHVDQGTPEEKYVWPYFARVPLKTLTPAQKVDLFRIVTGGDYKDMLDTGAYNFYRIGIGQDGAWRFFVTGN
ncbi:MAG TPA: hypothetical protein VGG01_16290 [Xanthobacteraceae bacterium]|jgi:hypothetical protein